MLRMYENFYLKYCAKKTCLSVADVKLLLVQNAQVSKYTSKFVKC